MESTRKATDFLLLSKTIHIALFTITVYPILISSITVTTHDKPNEIKLALIGPKESTNASFNGTLAVSERQKRLLPYYNFYMGNGFNQPPTQNQNNQKYQLVVPKNTNQQPYLIKYGDIRQQQQIRAQDNHLLYQPKEKFTPFLESNALPGPFVPMTRNQNENIEPPATVPQYTLSQHRHPEKLPPNYGALYDKLSQLKLIQQGISSRPESYSQNVRINPKQVPQKVNYIPLHEYQENNVQYKPIQPTKTYLHTYTATNIDIPSNSNKQYIPQYQTAQKQLYKPYLKQVAESPHQDHVKPLTPEEHQQYYEDQKKFTEATKTPLRKPIIILQSKPLNQQQIVYINDKGYGIPIQKYAPIPIDNYEQVQKYQYVPYEKQEYQNVLTTPQPPTYVENPNQNSIGHILKQLQDTNALPQTLTPENIDNSIKTLVKILTALKKQSKFSKPIVVTDENHPEYEEDGGNNEAEINTVQPVEIQGGSVTQIFPANTPEGGTPGKAGVDYPALSTIPKTTFNCKTQRYKGFFGDPDTNCQVWHYCDLNGGQASFLCPNGTIFSQVALTCDWWYNVKCSSTAQLYVLNERLYKYILPLSPKFPEDYSGPLVDKYLALKFKEMEEKMRKHKKGKQPPPPEEIIQEAIDGEIITEEALEHNEAKKEVDELSKEEVEEEVGEEAEETTNTTILNEK